MKAKDIAKAKSPELRDSLVALRRAGTLARETAIQTDTRLVVVKDGKLVRISADQLRREAKRGKTA